eukprot:11025545-Ditylum_brightwellii.AAC.1
MMYIDHHIPAKDVPFVTNKAARKDLRNYFDGFGQVQNDRAWIPDARLQKYRYPMMTLPKEQCGKMQYPNKKLLSAKNIGTAVDVPAGSTLDAG